MALLNTIKNTLLQSPVKVIGGAVKNVVNSAVNAYTAPSKAVVNAVSTPPMRPPVQQADGFSNRTSTSVLPPVPAPKPVAQAAPIRPPVAAPQPSVKPVAQAPAVQPMRPPTVTPVSSSPMTVPSPIAMPPQAPTARVSEAPPMRPPQPTMSSVTPVVKQEDRSAQLKALQDAYVRSLNVSGEEQDAQRALDNLTYSKEMGLNNIRDQAIPMGFITGQSASVERRAQEKMIPLQQQLAMAQARRAAMSQGVKAQLDFAQKEAEQQAAIERERNKPIEVGNSLIQYDPETKTYKTMFSAPEKPQAPEIREANGVIYERSQDGSWKAVAGSPKADSQQPDIKTINGQSAQWDANTNSWTPVNLPSNASPEKQQKAKEVLSLAQNLLNSPSLSSAVGPMSTMLPTLRGNTADFEANVNRLKSLLTLENLGLLKGAMSDKDLELLSSAASALSPKMSETGFKTELQNIINKMNGVISNSGDSSVESYAQSRGFSTQEVQALRSRGRTDEQIRQLIDQQGFNNAVPAQAQNGVEARVDKLAKAIAQHETGNRNIPGATGELATRYQFMPSTWKNLAKKYLGNANAPTTDQNQDFIAKAYISDLFKQGYNEQQIAMIWNGGTPTRKVGTTKTTTGKTINYDTGKYADKVLSIYKNLS